VNEASEGMSEGKTRRRERVRDTHTHKKGYKNVCKAKKKKEMTTTKKRSTTEGEE